MHEEAANQNLNQHDELVIYLELLLQFIQLKYLQAVFSF